MFMVLLKLSGSKERVSELMEGHKAWLQRGFDEGVFLASGNLQGQPGGGILAHGVDASELQQRLDSDPFVAQGVVTVDIIGLAPSKADPRLAFLLEGRA